MDMQTSQKIVQKNLCLNRKGEKIIDQMTGQKFKLGKFLGKGSFGSCYELIDESETQISAVKIIDKKTLLNEHIKLKLVKEI
jgi:hypothetical protein